MRCFPPGVILVIVVECQGMFCGTVVHHLASRLSEGEERSGREKGSLEIRVLDPRFLTVRVWLAPNIAG